MAIEEHLPLSVREFHILIAVSDEPLNGYQIRQAVEESTGGAVRLSPATQYVNLHKLAEKKFLTEVTDREQHRTDGRGQRYWSLTQLGRSVLRAEAERLAADARLAWASVGRGG